MKEFLNEFELKDTDINLNKYYFRSGIKIEQNMVINDVFPFRYIIYDNFQSLPLQGWKIHLSPTLDKYPSVLRRVTEILQKERVSFKYVPDTESFMALSNKNTGVSQFGKYITIYPCNKDEFVKLIEKIYLDIDCKTGVQIPSDQKYKDSDFIFYRYGSVFPKQEITNFNEKDHQIMDGFGELGREVKKGYFTLPDGIKDPFERFIFNDETVQEVKVKGKLTNNTFSINKILRHSAIGNVYEGYDDLNGKGIIIKEGRLGGIPLVNEPLYRAQKARKNEFEFFNKNHNKYNLLLPRAIDYFYEGDSIFIVVEKLKGKSLREFISETPLAKPKKSEKEKIDFINTLKRIFDEIFEFVLQLHSNGYVLNDISDDNFLITSRNQISLIDAEGISTIEDNEWYLMGTDRFMYRIPKGIRSDLKDIYMTSQLILYSIIGKNRGYFFDESFYEKEYETILPRLPVGTKDIFEAGILLRDTVLRGYSLENLGDKFKETLFKHNNKSPVKINVETEKDLNLISRIENIETVLLKYYSNIIADNPENIFKFRTSDYLDNRLSLIYGLPGVSLCLHDFNIIDERQLLDTANILQQFAMETDNTSKLNDGLIFGKAGLALYLAQSGIPIENNHFFFSMIKKIKELNFDNLDFANGLSGIYTSLKLINTNKEYPKINKWVDIVRKKLESITMPISDYQGLEYGNIGVAYSLIFAEQKDYNWETIYNIINEDLKTVSEDSYFSGLSYNIKEWPNIRSPYVFAGGAGLILPLLHHYHKNGGHNWDFILDLVTSLDSPFTYNYGITYGSAGLALVIMGILLLPDIPDEIKEKFEYILTHNINYTITHFQNNSKVIGFLGDKQSFYADDFGNGGLGILKILKLYKKYYEGRLSWDEYNFSSLPPLR
ncbi:Protein kinase domain-containing protein [Oceanobacillus limi]|uniref:Protein kinase domain-containing protein n=1 Tax=Oceanobacillus limi TaxID=930131 RepID=A0A1I0CYZ7_9BACI|nr:hypothetical protein [Oceanobacillus limi]SET25084.1 Protein kinase domain-containing protein [Oceanobacillus limi]